MKSCESILQCIGNTPLVRVKKLLEFQHTAGAEIYLKLEGENPGGSIKTRAALYTIEKAERQGKLGAEQNLVIEAANINTAIGLAVVCAAKKYKLVVIMPDTDENSHYSVLHAYGVQVVLTPGEDGMRGAVKKADLLCKKYADAFRPRVFYRTAAVMAYKSVANEIWKQTDGRVDILVAGVGSGATVTGVGSALKRRKKSVQVVAVEAAEAQCLLGIKKRETHGIRGISCGETPPLADIDIIDEVYPVVSSDAYGACVGIASNDGILIGISAGAALNTACLLARIPENTGKVIVAIAPDSGEKYLETGLYDYNESYIIVE